LGSKAVADKYGIDKIPAIAVLGEGDRDHGIRLFGMPAGYEFSSLLEAVKMASSGASGLSPEAREALKGLKKSIHIQVFNLPLLSHGGANGHRLAVESDLIRADMTEASEFPHLANRYGVYAVPRVVMNERVSFGEPFPRRPSWTTFSKLGVSRNFCRRYRKLTLKLY